MQVEQHIGLRHEFFEDDCDLAIDMTVIIAAEPPVQITLITTRILVDRLDMGSCQLLIDLNYGREQNIWERKAAASDVMFMDGLRTLAYQARRTFALWTGVQVEPNEFLDALKVL